MNMHTTQHPFTQATSNQAAIDDILQMDWRVRLNDSVMPYIKAEVLDDMTLGQIRRITEALQSQDIGCKLVDSDGVYSIAVDSGDSFVKLTNLLKPKDVKAVANSDWRLASKGGENFIRCETPDPKMSSALKSALYRLGVEFKFNNQTSNGINAIDVTGSEYMQKLTQIIVEGRKVPALKMPDPRTAFTPE